MKKKKKDTKLFIVFSSPKEAVLVIETLFWKNWIPLFISTKFITGEDKHTSNVAGFFSPHARKYQDVRLHSVTFCRMQTSILLWLFWPTTERAQSYDRSHNKNKAVLCDKCITRTLINRLQQMYRRRFEDHCLKELDFKHTAYNSM